MPGRPNDEHSPSKRKRDASEPIAFLATQPFTLADDAANGGISLNQPVGDGTRLPSKLRGTAVETSSG